MLQSGPIGWQWMTTERGIGMRTNLAAMEKCGSKLAGELHDAYSRIGIKL